MLKSLALTALLSLTAFSALASAPTFYVIDVTDGAGDEEFAFSTPAETVHLPPHPEGLIVQFRNLTRKNVVIHGDGMIPHQDPSHPMTPAQTNPVTGALEPSPHGIYQLAPIWPSDGSDLESYYTIHDVYTPERTVVFNSSGSAL